jgi:hypothetical protein
MQDIKKFVEVNRLVGDISRRNLDLSHPKLGAHYDYERVIQMLNEVKSVMEESARCPRPPGLQKDILWCEKFCNGDNELDPFVYDGSTLPDEFQQWQDRVLENMSFERD